MHSSPDLFRPHPNLCDRVNRRIVESELEGGVHLNRISPRTTLEVRTRHNVYTIRYRPDGECTIDGHPIFCPTPVRAHISGSTWGGSMIWSNFIGRGMRMEFLIPDYGRITTSPVEEIREVAP